MATPEVPIQTIDVSLGTSMYDIIPKIEAVGEPRLFLKDGRDAWVIDPNAKNIEYHGSTRYSHEKNGEFRLNFNGIKGALDLAVSTGYNLTVSDEIAEAARQMEGGTVPMTIDPTENSVFPQFEGLKYGQADEEMARRLALGADFAKRAGETLMPDKDTFFMLMGR